MTKRKPKVVKLQWSVPMRVEYRTDVLVEAVTEEDAADLAKSGDWVDDGAVLAKLVDWEIQGRPKAAR